VQDAQHTSSNIMMQGIIMKKENDQISQIAERYYRSIYCYCAAKLGDSEAAKDCTQEVFLALVKKQHLLNDPENIRGWLYRAADLAMREYRRKNAKYVATPEEELLRLAESAAPAPDDQQIRSLLTDSEYQLLVSHYTEGYPICEIAQQLGISEAAAYQRMSRIRRKLSVALGRGDAL